MFSTFIRHSKTDIPGNYFSFFFYMQFDNPNKLSRKVLRSDNNNDGGDDN